MKVKLYQIVNIDLNDINPDLQKLIAFNARNAGLRYDIQVKLAKAVCKEYNDFQEARESLCRNLSTIKEVEIEGEKVSTPFIVEEIDGKPTITKTYDIPADKDNEFNVQLMELLQNEVELNCYPISLRKLDAEPDTSMLDFGVLEPFIIDDRNK